MYRTFYFLFLYKIIYLETVEDLWSKTIVVEDYSIALIFAIPER